MKPREIPSYRLPGEAAATLTVRGHSGHSSSFIQALSSPHSITWTNSGWDSPRSQLLPGTARAEKPHYLNLTGTLKVIKHLYKFLSNRPHSSWAGKGQRHTHVLGTRTPCRVHPSEPLPQRAELLPRLPKKLQKATQIILTEMCTHVHGTLTCL